MAVKNKCEVCGSEFSVSPCRANSAKACSKECRLIVAAKSRSRPKIELTCKRCGKSFIERQCHAERRVFCSMECRNADYLESSPKRIGKDNPAWKGGRILRSDGYLYISSYEHPFTSNGYVLEHRIVIEESMRKMNPTHHFMVEIEGDVYLMPDIDVHHLDHNKANNDQSNLVACTKQAHKDIHSGRLTEIGQVWPEQCNSVQHDPGRTDRICSTCRKSFKAKPADVLRGGAKFCSRKCYDLSRTTDVTLPVLINVTCETCGMLFDAKRYKVAKGEAKFCSSDCYQKSRRKSKSTQE